MATIVYGENNGAEGLSHLAVNFNGDAPVVGNDSFAVGEYVTASGQGSVAIGRNTDTNGSNALALVGGDANANKAISIGQSSNVDGEGSIAIGESSSATSTNSVSIGTNAKCTYWDSVAIGVGSNSFNYNNVSIGLQAKCTNLGSTAIGAHADTSHNYTTAVGYNATVVQSNSTAIGYNTTTTASNQIMLGHTSIESVRVGNTSYEPTHANDLADKNYVDNRGMSYKLKEVSQGNIENVVIGREYYSPDQHGGIFGTVYRRYLIEYPDTTSIQTHTILTAGTVDKLIDSKFLVHNMGTNKQEAIDNVSYSANYRIRASVTSSGALEVEQGIDYHLYGGWVDYTKQ